MNSSNQPHRPTREEISRLPDRERKALIERIRVGYSQWDEITKEIEKCHQLQPDAVEPPGLFLVGHTRAGKSTILRYYANKFPPVHTDTGKVQSVLYVSIPSSGSVSDLATLILDALGDPRAERGTTGNKTLRVERYIKDVQVSLVMFDELQHFVDRESLRVLANASNWLKDLIKQTRIACVLAGLEGYSELVVNTNEQLGSMFPDPICLAPFACDETKQEAGTEFCVFLAKLESMLPLAEASHLADEDCGWRCYVASGGVIGYMMMLIRTAARMALDARREHIDNVLLADAYNKRLGGKRRGIPNPFVGTERPELLKKAGSPTLRIGNMNRRSRARIERADQMKDYF